MVSDHYQACKGVIALRDRNGSGKGRSGGFTNQDGNHGRSGHLKLDLLPIGKSDCATWCQPIFRSLGYEGPSP